jgi:predicted amidophosphoribosyltransferase
MQAIAMKNQGSPLERTIIAYKYHARSGWRLIFARLLLGWLERTLDPEDVDLIVATPTYTGPPKWRFPHTEAVIDSAAVQDIRGLWPFDQEEPRAIVATGQRSQSAGGSLADKQAAAAELAALLLVPNPARVIGKRVLIYDDVLTSGETLNTVAGALRRVGAAEVSGVVLARQGWSS